MTAMTAMTARPISVRDAMTAVVAELGDDHLYPRSHRDRGEEDGACQYVHDGQPDCLIGRVLHRMGASVAALARLETRSAPDVAILALPGRLSPDELRALRQAQWAFDNGRTAGAAHEAFLAELRFEPAR